MAGVMSQRVLITGIAGGMGRLVARHLLATGHTVFGIDERPWHGHPEGIDVHLCDLRKRRAEDVFRTRRPEIVMHLAATRPSELSMRYQRNFDVAGHLFEYVERYGVKKVVFSSRAVVYGALPDHPQFLTEDAPPFAAGTYPELADAVAADLFAQGQIWRRPETETVLLRPVNAIGPTTDGILNRYLRVQRVPTILGFDPMMQVIHEDDLATAFELAMGPGVRGVFNVTGPGEIPLSVLIDELGGTRVPLPFGVAKRLLGRFGFPRIPPGALDFLRYSSTVDGGRFRAATGFVPRFDLKATLTSVREARQRWQPEQRAS
jgi:UDP-glucose 4-epimerase